MSSYSRNAVVRRQGANYEDDEESDLERCAKQLVTLVNRYNSVYSPDKSAKAIAEQVMKLCKNTFNVSTVITKRGYYKVKVSAYQFKPFCGFAQTEGDAKESAFSQQFDYIHSLSRFFAFFQLVNKPVRTSKEIFDELLAWDAANPRFHPDTKPLIHFKIYPPRPDYNQPHFKVSFIIYNLINVSKTAVEKALALKLTSLKAVKEIEELSKRVRPSARMTETIIRGSYVPKKAKEKLLDSWPLILPTPSTSNASSEERKNIWDNPFPESSSPSSSESSFETSCNYKKNITTAAKPMFALPPPPTISSHMNSSSYVLKDRDFRLIKLLNLFASVYTPEKPKWVVIEELIGLEGVLGSLRDGDLMESKNSSVQSHGILTSIESKDLGVFHGLAGTAPQSKTEAFKKIYSLLERLTTMFAHFEELSNSVSNFLSSSELLFCLLAKDDSIFSLQTFEKFDKQTKKRNSISHYQATLIIQNFHYFSVDDENLERAKETVFGRAVNFLHAISPHLKMSPKKKVSPGPEKCPSAFCFSWQ